MSTIRMEKKLSTQKEVWLSEGQEEPEEEFEELAARGARRGRGGTLVDPFFICF